jgi:hypothetical protein
LLLRQGRGSIAAIERGLRRYLPAQERWTIREHLSETHYDRSAAQTRRRKTHIDQDTTSQVGITYSNKFSHSSYFLSSIVRMSARSPGRATNNVNHQIYREILCNLAAFKAETEEVQHSAP